MRIRVDQSFVRLHVAVLLAGGTGLFGRLVNIGELPLVWWRVLLSAIIMAVVMALSNKLRRLSLHHLLLLGGCGILLAMHWTLFYASIKTSNVSIGAVCVSLDGFFTALLEPLIFRRRVSWRELLLGIVAVMGIVLIFGFDDRYRLGIALGCVASCLYALFAIFSRRVEVSTGINSSTMLLHGLISGGVFLTLATGVYSLLFPEERIMPTAHDAVMLVLLASVFTVIPFLLQLQALRTIPAFTVNLSYNLEPIYTIALAMVIFGEGSELNVSFYAGIALIVFSVVTQTLLTVRNRKKTLPVSR